MKLNFEVFKKHPYGWLGGGLALFVLIYLYERSKHSSAASTNTVVQSNGPSAADLQYAQMQTAAQLQSNQTAAQVQVAGLQANVQNNAITAQADTAAEQVAAQLAAIQAQTAATVQENATNNATQVSMSQITANAQTTTAQLQAQENETQTNALKSIEENQTNAQVNEHGQTLNYLGTVAGYQSSLQSQSMAEQAQLTSQQLSAHEADTQAVLAAVNKAGLNHGTTSLENDLTQITESALGQPAPAIANASSTAGTVYAQGSTNPLSILASQAGNIITGLFA